MKSQPIWYSIDWLGTRQYRERVRVSRSRGLLSLLTSPQASPELQITEEGESGVFPDTKYVEPTAQCPLTLDTISVELVLMPRLRYRDCPDFSASRVFSSYHVSEQVTETRNFHSTSMLKNSVKPVNKLRKTLIHCSQSNIQEKTQKQWNGGDL